MNREELIKKLATVFAHKDYDGYLINFFDDEVHWERIAEVAIDFMETHMEVKDD